MGMPYQVSPRIQSLIKETSSLEKALEVIQASLVKYCSSSEKDDESQPLFDLDRLLIAFNGGKDCTLMLKLIMMAARGIGNTRGKLRLMFIRDDPEETFPEVAEFVEKTKRLYNIDSIEVASGDMRVALEKIVRENPEVGGIFMGTRATDPNAGWMDYFCHTSAGWPKMNLIAPILHMSYTEVWRIMESLGIDYCSLYKRGYTSIGRKSNTVPNPLLRLDGSDKFLHACTLSDESKERCGRI